MRPDGPDGGPGSLDEVLGAPHFSEHHARRVDAPPSAVWAALQDIRLEELPLSRALMDVRMLPARILGRATPRAVAGRVVEHAPVPVLGLRRGRAVVAGGVMQPWRLTGDASAPRLDAEALRAFAEPGWVKVGVAFLLQPDAAGTRLSTETRVRATDTRTRLVFGAYWLVVRTGSGLIRRELLRAVARRAERLAPSGA